MTTLPLLPLTSLRFFAAAAIVLFHLQGAIIGSQKTWLALGVGFFFCLSGFILTYVYKDFRGHSIRAFYLSRFARLWPIHFVTFLIAWLAFDQLIPNAVKVMTMPYHLTLTHSWLPVSGLVFAWNGPSWSISAEMWFYLFFPILAVTRRFWLWFAALSAVAFCIVGAITLSGVQLKTNGVALSPVHMLLHHPAVRIVEFACGVAAGRLFNSGYRIPGNGTAMEILALTLVAGFAFSTILAVPYLGAYPPLMIWYAQCGGPLAFTAAIFIFAQGGGLVSKALSWRPLFYLGEISFATYMLHYLVIRWAQEHGWVAAYGKAWTVVLIVVISYAGSAVLFHLVEKSGKRIILSLPDRIRTIVLS